jgi:hypothetical protein
MAYEIRRCSLIVTFLALTVGLTGCTLVTTAPSTPVTAPAIKGSVFGGQQPVVGAHVYVFAANTAGYNTTGPTYASVSLLQPGSGTTMDSNGNYYVTTGSYGSFTISNEYSCTPGSGNVPGQQVYLYAVGGNSSYGTNNSVGLMAVLGDCPSTGNFAAATPTVQMNEVTTVAAAYAMAGFAYDATHVSSANTTLAKIGVKNAFANAANLASLSTGLAYTTTPAGNGTVPQSTIYTLADILAACINSNGAVTGPNPTGPNPSSGPPTACYTLFYSAESAGSSGSVPSDTATAAINIAHNPGSNVAALYALPSSTSPFVPELSSQPNDFTIGINFTGGGLNSPRGIAVDASGDLWVANTYGTNNSNSSVVELSSTGTVLSGTNGFTSGGINLPVGIAIDHSGNAWITNYTGNSITELSSTGTVLSNAGAGPYSGGGIAGPWTIAIDGPGNVWVTSPTSPAVVTKLSSSGAFLSGTSGYNAGGTLSGFLGIALDGSGNAWIANGSGDNVVELSSTGTVLSGTGGYNVSSLLRNIAMDSSGNAWAISNSLFELSNSGSLLSPSGGYTTAGIKQPYYGVALDGAGNVWTANNNGSVSELTNSGTALSPTTGYTGGQQAFDWGIAIDGSGDTWVANYNNGSGGSITELIGSATPVITPICAGLPVTPTSNGTSSLGTRP